MRMKQAKSLTFVLFLTLFVVSAVPLEMQTNVAGQVGAATTLEKGRMVPSYTSHNAIKIENDTDFMWQAGNESWSGNGLEGTPYIIQGYSIINDTHTCIDIQNVSVYFEIRDCLLGAVVPGSSDNGIYLENVANPRIEDCVFTGKDRALFMFDAHLADVDNCTMTNNGMGADLDSCNYTTFIDCNITGSTWGSAVALLNSHWTNFTNNDFYSNAESGVQVYTSNDCSLVNNRVYDHVFDGMYFESSNFTTLINNTIYYNDDSGIYTENSINFTLQDNNIYGNEFHGLRVRLGHNWEIISNTVFDNGLWDYQGVNLWNSDNAIVVDNTIYNNTAHGIYLSFSEDCRVENNEIFDNGWTRFGVVGSGVYSRDSSGLNLIGNELRNNSEHGAWIRTSDNSTITDNTVYRNHGKAGVGCGLYIYQSDLSNITNNVIYNNTRNGIRAYYTDNCTFFNNTIYDSTFSGIKGEISANCTVNSNVIYDNGEYGIHLDAVDDWVLYDNDIGWNVLGNALDDSGDNHWNNSMGAGNFWSDYGGESTYSISGTGDSVDNFPKYSLYPGYSTDEDYELGDTGNTLSWNSTAANPGNYVVIKNGSLYETDTWVGGTLVVDIDGLSVGYHNMTLVVYHVSGHSRSNTAYVDVVDNTDPVFEQTPSDIEIEVGESPTVWWIASDLDPSSYVLYLDGDVMASGDWTISPENFSTTISGLDVGSHNVTLSVTDGSGNTVTDTVTITVVEPTTTSTTTTTTPPPTTTTTTPTETTSPPPTDGDLTGLLVVVGGGAGVVIIIVIVVASKRRGG